MASRKLMAALLVFGATVQISGCTHQLLRPAPRSTTPLAVVFTNKNISGMSDLPAGTYQVPDSQVLISGHQKASASPASLMFGVVGVLVANQIDKSSAKAKYFVFMIKDKGKPVSRSVTLQ